MSEPESQHNEKIWKIFIRKHWSIFAVLIAATLIAIAGAVLVFLWFVGEAQTTNLVPPTIGLWTMGHLVTFLFNVLFWELLIIGLPIIVFIIAICHAISPPTIPLANIAIKLACGAG